MPIPLVEPLGQVRTKIVATLGPASRSPEMIRRLIDAGVDVFRLNFSHGSHDDHSQTLRDIRSVAASADRFVVGPWRWMIVVYAFDEADDRVAILTIQDARSARAATGGVALMIRDSSAG